MKKQITIIVTVLVLVLLGAFFARKDNGPSIYDSFATCIKDSGATFYGAFWCPHCQDQKKMFGNASKFLPYVECSTPDGQSQLAICKDNNISSYPTWVFANGERSNGTVQLADLASTTRCQLPVVTQ